MPKLSRATCGATKTSVLASRSRFARPRPRRAPAPADGRPLDPVQTVAGQTHLDVADRRPDRRQRGQQHRQALPRLVQPTEERHPRPVTAAPRPVERTRASGGVRQEGGVVEAVRDHHRIPAEVVDDDVAGRLRHRDPGVDLLDRAGAALRRRPAWSGTVASLCGRSPPPVRRRTRARAARSIGVIGSWMCTRSNRPSRSQRRTRPAVTGRSSPGRPSRCRDRHRRTGGGERQVGVLSVQVARGQDAGRCPSGAGARPARRRDSGRRRAGRSCTGRRARSAARSRRRPLENQRREEGLQQVPVLRPAPDRRRRRCPRPAGSSTAAPRDRPLTDLGTESITIVRRRN